MTGASPQSGEILYGVKSIAAFLGITHRQALYLIEKGCVPFWREGRTILASRAAVRAWITQRAVAQ